MNAEPRSGFLGSGAQIASRHATLTPCAGTQSPVASGCQSPPEKFRSLAGVHSNGAHAGSRPCRMSNRVCGRTPLRPYGRRQREPRSAASPEHADFSTDVRCRTRRGDALVRRATCTHRAVDGGSVVRKGHRAGVRVGDLCDWDRPRRSGRLTRSSRLRSLTHR